MTTPRRPGAGLTAAVLAATLAVGLAACGDDEPADGTGAPEGTEAADATDAPDGTDAPDDTDPSEDTDAPDDTETEDTEGTDDGDAPEGDALSAEEWRADVTGLCAEAGERGDDIAEPETIGDLRDSFDEIETIGDDLFAEIGDLEAPEELSDDADRFKELWDERSDKIGEVEDRIDEAGYEDDQVLADIEEGEAEALVDDAFDSSDLVEQAKALGVDCFGSGDGG
ncbi:MAG: hypothetical protein M3501_09595 [Actinomycetota bacterium]|nr:hypothetical protein [Actinomycetota bacterium]MDQ3352200.1 hypothetical protein [Actinomycetota bacterium]